MNRSNTNSDAGLDPGAREKFLASIQEVAHRQRSVGLVLVTHHIEEIMPAFEKTAALNDGKLLRSGPTDEVLQPELVEELYGVSVEIRSHGGRYWPMCI